MKDILSLDLFKHLFFKITAQVLITLSLYYLAFAQEKRYILAAILIVVSIILIYFQNKSEDKNKFANCIEKCKTKIEFILGQVMYIIAMLGIVMFVFILMSEFSSQYLTKLEAIIISITMTIIGTSYYIFMCKKNKVV